MEPTMQYFIGPPNPIMQKEEATGSEQAKMQVQVQSQKAPPFLNPIMSVREEESDWEDSSVCNDDGQTLFESYPRSCLVYRKYKNQQPNERATKKYYASTFIHPSQLQPAQPYHDGNSELQFSSSEQSMNLFAVYQVSPTEYDLILQNDLNTCGYTQWFYFAVNNTHKQRKYRFNIVNLYKSMSLYQVGMKPLAYSERMGWRRSFTQVQYQKTELNIEHSRKYYYSLSFQYVFPCESDRTIFAHCYPYTYQHLNRAISGWEKNSAKVKVRNIGKTVMKNSIPVLHITNHYHLHQNKKALIFLARQHPGESVGSHILEEIIHQLLKNGPEMEFLLWRFDIYCFPMANIDGVIFGNYRGNAWGYDLNRSWNRDNLKKYPEISYIRGQIRKIAKSQPIQMILDLHGHSRKMGSFFYGNPFGKNTGLFPFIASKFSKNISFQESTFSQQKSEKMSTARIVLGNIIKQTGCFYTYETSFFGGWKNGKKIHFQLQNYKELAQNLVSVTHKTYIQLHKQQKALKESLYLRQIRKKVRNALLESKPGSQSDSEAERITLKELKHKQKQQKKEAKKKAKRKETSKIQQKSTSKKIDENQIKSLYIKRNQFKNQFLKKEKKIISMGMSPPKFQLFLEKKEEEQFEQNISKRQIFTVDNNRKNYLMKKLRIFGETFIEDKPSIQSIQTDNRKKIEEAEKIFNQKPSIRSHCQPKSSSVPKPMSLSGISRKKQNFRTKSLMIRLDKQTTPKIPINEMVRVNRINQKDIVQETQIGNKRDLRNFFHLK